MGKIKKIHYSRFGRASAYLVFFLLLVGIGFVLCKAAANTPSSYTYIKTNEIQPTLANAKKDGTEGYYYNLIGEIVYEVLYERMEEEDVYANLKMFGYTDTDIHDGISELGIDWESKTAQNKGSEYFHELVQAGVISEEGGMP